MTHAPPIKRRCQCPPHVPTSSHNLPQPARQTSATTVVGMVEMVTARSKHRADALVWSLLATHLTKPYSENQMGGKNSKAKKGGGKGGKGLSAPAGAAEYVGPALEAKWVEGTVTSTVRTPTQKSQSLSTHTTPCHHPSPPRYVMKKKNSLRGLPPAPLIPSY